MKLQSGGRVVREMPEFDLVVRGVCGPCNHNWLHDLERAFRAVMLGPMHGFPAVLSRPSQMVVALWAIKTWLMVETATAHARGGMIRPELAYFRRLRTASEPDPRTQVWIGRFIPGEDITRISTKPVIGGDGQPVGVIGILTIGHVLFQIYLPGIFEGFPEAQSMQLFMSDTMLRMLTPIWPHEVDEVIWPPPIAISVAQFDTLWGKPEPFKPGPPPD
jgi:hypothetical protein